jgi:hypothetical protein
MAQRWSVPTDRNFRRSGLPIVRNKETIWAGSGFAAARSFLLKKAQEPLLRENALMAQGA